MKVDAIIGHSGFVGAALSRQFAFEAQFNTSNIDELRGRQFDTLVCAAAPGSMFTANLDPDRDRAQVDALIERLNEVSTRRFVLISSIAVLADFAGGYDEGTQAFQEDLAYGRHRRMLETFCEERFDHCLIVRLPALFGPGLRKNFIFDLLNPVPSMLTQGRLAEVLARLSVPERALLSRIYVNSSNGIYQIDRAALHAYPNHEALGDALRDIGMSAIQFHNPESTFQYYNLSRLWQDIETASRSSLRCIHLATEPLRASEIHAHLLGSEMPRTEAPPHLEDMHTRFSHIWGRQGPYLESANSVLRSLKAFFDAERKAA